MTFNIFCRCKKILKCRAFPKSASKEERGQAWGGDVSSMGYEILLVSQFTLYARLKKSKPDFSKAMPPNQVRSTLDRETPSGEVKHWFSHLHACIAAQLHQYDLKFNML